MNVSVGADSAKITALQARYGADALPAAGPWNDTLALLLSHRSVRAYRTDPLPAGTLETLIAAAQSAATSSNLQTWSVVSVTDPEKKKVLAEIANNQKHIEQCPLFLVFLADVSRLDRLASAKSMTFEGLPYVETFLVAAIDAALAAQNAVIAAESLGLSTVYIGAMRNDVERVARDSGAAEGRRRRFRAVRRAMPIRKRRRRSNRACSRTRSYTPIAMSCPMRPPSAPPTTPSSPASRSATRWCSTPGRSA